ncbi:MAG: aspartyl protease family protein [Roseiflexus sp.]|nr:aspartyl protease family protein [Roseiflexus sp.]
MNTLAYLDTGANLITISPKLAESLPRTGTVTIGSAFEQRVFEAVEAIEIGFLGYNRRVGARVKPISDSALPFNSDVTLDASTIFAQTLIFDFRLLGILLPKQVSGELWLELLTKFVEDTGICLIQLASQNATVSALFDTGAGLSVINSAHIEELGLDLQPAFELEIGDAVGAKTTQTVSLCSGLRIADAALPPFDCFSADLQAIEKVLGCRIDMVFGANAMLKSGFRWLFDKLAGKAFVAG